MKDTVLASTSSEPTLRPIVAYSLGPILVPIRKAVEISGLSRSTIYLRAKAGELTLKKAGKTTLVDFASLRALLDGLPTAQLKPNA
jgi:hypothetical protein